MPDKPSYLGLLNAVSNGETAAHCYLTAWIGVCESDDVRAVLTTVAHREGEHGMSFAKRINELGYQLRVKEDPGQADRLALAGSTTLTDLEKMEKLGLGRLDSSDKPDLFDNFFKDHSIDIKTGELLGRYIAEERDTGRLLRNCYLQLKEQRQGGSSSRIDALDAKVDALCETVEQLCSMLTDDAKPNGKNGSRRVAASRDR